MIEYTYNGKTILISKNSEAFKFWSDKKFNELHKSLADAEAAAKKRGEIN